MESGSCDGKDAAFCVLCFDGGGGGGGGGCVADYTNVAVLHALRRCRFFCSVRKQLRWLSGRY